MMPLMPHRVQFATQKNHEADVSSISLSPRTFASPPLKQGIQETCKWLQKYATTPIIRNGALLSTTLKSWSVIIRPVSSVAQKLDSTTHWINHYPLDKTIKEASFVLSKLPVCLNTQQSTLTHEPIILFYNIFNVVA